MSEMSRDFDEDDLASSTKSKAVVEDAKSSWFADMWSALTETSKRDIFGSLYEAMATKN